MGLWVVSLVFGTGCRLFSRKCRGRNARNAFMLASWGFFLLLLIKLPLLLPLLLLKFVPSVICFILAIQSIMKEMKAQANSEYTDPA